MTGSFTPASPADTSEQVPPAPPEATETMPSPLPGATADPGGGAAAATGAPSSTGEPREFTVTIPFDKIASAAAATVLAPAAIARRVLPAKGGLPLYAGLGGLALVGVVDWPVAVAAGAGYGLARLWARQDSEGSHH